MILALLVVLALAETYRRTRHRLRALWPRLRRDWRELIARGAISLKRVTVAEWIGVALATALAIALRWRPLFQPMRYDEAATWIDYASQPLAKSLSDYRFPNNHLFHTLLVHLSAAMFGSAPWSLRLPAFIAGVLVIPLTWAAGRALYSPSAGLLAAMLAATSASLTLYSTNARGYTILCCLTLLAVLVAARLPRRENVAGWALLAGLGALGMWTIPIMLYPLAGIALWLWAEARAGDTVIEPPAMAQRLLWTTVAMLSTTAVLYLPVVARSGITLVVGNRFVRPQSRSSFFAGLPHFYRDVWGDWTRGWPWWLALLAGIGITIATVLRGSRARRSVSLAGAAAVAATLLLLVNGRIPYLRVWLYLLPLALVAAGGGLTHAWRWLARLFPPLQRAGAARGALVLAMAVIGAGGASGLTRSGVVLRADDTGAFPDASAVVAQLLARSGAGDRVIATAPADLPLAYYLQPTVRGRALLTATPDSARRIWIVVDGAEQQDVNVLLRRAEIMTVDFSPPHAVWRAGDATLFMIARERPGCRLAPARCR
ncbi:MAG: glycosyltransferase family 39 protein [Gemmatimonadaceae bacterium]